jgi:aspartate racemase
MTPSRQEKAAITILRIADQLATDQKAIDRKVAVTSVGSIAYILSKIADCASEANHHASTLLKSDNFRPDAFYYAGMSLDKAQRYADMVDLGSDTAYDEDVRHAAEEACRLYLTTQHTVHEATDKAIEDAKAFLAKLGGNDRKLTIGIIGGMGPGACVTLQKQIIDATVAKKDQDHLHVIANDDPAIPDRTAFILDPTKENPTPKLRETALILQNAGADVLVASCNTASKFAPEVATAIHIPLLDWPAEVATSLVIAIPELKRLGLFASTGTVKTGIYHDAFEQYGISIVTPDPQVQDEQVMGSIYSQSWGIKSDKTNVDKVTEAMSKAAGHLQEQGAQAVLLACTEFSSFFNVHPYQGTLPTFDASQAIAKRLIVLAGGQLRIEE